MESGRVARTPWVRVLGVAIAALLLAAACGSSKSSSSGESTSGTPVPTPDVTKAPSGPPKTGGSVSFGLEAENSGMDATNDRWAIAGNMQASAIYDALTAYDANGKAQPYLAQSLTPSADFKTWTIKLRPNITFTNGEPLTGQAGANFLNAIRASALTGAALKNLETVAVDPADPLSIVVTTKIPWASFPAVLVGQAGMIPAPAQLAAAPGEKASRQPIGTGPFIMKEWVPDSKMTLTKNPNYWRKDSSGAQLPYLDQLVFRPIPDVQNRANALQSGDINMMHTSNPATIKLLEGKAKSGDLQAVVDKGANEETFFMINTAKAPFDDVRVRQALAYGTDVDAYLNVQQIDPATKADSPFNKDDPYYADSNFPTYDPAKAKALIDEYKAEKGISDITFSLATTPVPENQAVVQQIAEQWAQIGVNAQPKGTEQGQFIVDAALGNYDVNLWRQFGAQDPDGDYVWWTSNSVAPIGALSLNFARLSDPQIDAALDQARGSADPAVRKAAYKTVQERWAQLVPYVWLNHTQWLIAAANDVRGLSNGPLPDGQESAPYQSGTFRLTATWIDK